MRTARIILKSTWDAYACPYCGRPVFIGDSICYLNATEQDYSATFHIECYIKFLESKIQKIV